MEPDNQDYRPQNKQPDIFAPNPVIDPQASNPYQPTQAQQPPAQSPPPAVSPNPVNDDRTKKLLFAIAGLIGIFVIIVIVVFATKGSDSNNDQNATSDTNSASFYVKEPTPVDIENISNSIGDDVSGMSTDTDFPKDNLTDENLNL